MLIFASEQFVKTNLETEVDPTRHHSVLALRRIARTPVDKTIKPGQAPHLQVERGFLAPVPTPSQYQKVRRLL